MTATIGELCAGYGGLGMGISSVLDAEVAWVADVCKFNKDGNAGHHEPHRAPCTILEHRFPGVPNLGDITRVDWSTVPPVDVLCGGTPCQDLSHAGKRRGMTEGTRSNLWVAMREAIATLHPSLVVWENVSGAYSAEADSDLGSDPRLLADTRRRDGDPVLRALGRVLGDLASLGYVGGWHGLRAADVGAPHGRLRVFVVAYPTSDAGRFVNGDGATAADADGRIDQRGRARTDQRSMAAGDGRGAGSDRLLPSPRTSDTNGPGAHGDGGLDPAVAMLPTPMARDHKGAGPADLERHNPNLSAITHLLPTPAVNDMGAAYTPETWDAWTADMQAKHGNGNGHGKSLNIEAQRMLPTPRATHWAKTSDKARELYGSTDSMQDVVDKDAWGDYAEAIHRWETLTRSAPEPTMLSRKNTPQLSPAFSEWMMGLPAGWVTDVPGISRSQALKALGNGVVPQQAAAAVAFLLDILSGQVAA